MSAPAAEEWGLEGLWKAVSSSAAQPAEAIVHAIFTSLDEFSRGNQADDATVAVLRVR
jgi:serine phosphatase RsbU (regulator of sigma subunit)